MRCTLAVIPLALLACAPAGGNGEAATSPPDLSLSVEPEAVAAGDSLTLTLSNASSGPLGYNLCSSRLERRTDNEWEPIREDRMCTLELRTLPPGENTTFSLQLPAALEAGEYRFATNIEMLDGTERNLVRSTSFQVTE